MARPEITRPPLLPSPPEWPRVCHPQRQQKLLPGAYDSAESRGAYDRLVTEYLNAGRTVPVDPSPGVTVSTIAVAFYRHAKAAYVGADGTPTGEADNYRPAIAAL